MDKPRGPSRRRQSHAYERRRLRMIAEQARGQILDLGYAQLPNPYLPGDRTVGVDLDRPAAPSGYVEELEGSVLDLASLLGQRRFDTIVAAELIEHLEEPYAFLRATRDALRPGGLLILSTPNPIAFPTLLMEATRSKRWFYTEDHTYYFTARWVERMLTRTGYVVERIQPVGIWLPFGYLPVSPIWLSYQLIYLARKRDPNR